MAESRADIGRGLPDMRAGKARPVSKGEHTRPRVFRSAPSRFGGGDGADGSRKEEGMKKRKRFPARAPETARGARALPLDPEVAPAPLFARLNTRSMREMLPGGTRKGLPPAPVETTARPNFSIPTPKSCPYS